MFTALGILLLLGGGGVLLLVLAPDIIRSYLHRPRHTRRACTRRIQAMEVQRVEDWFREWRKQYPALLEETVAVSVLRDR